MSSRCREVLLRGCKRPVPTGSGLLGLAEACAAAGATQIACSMVPTKATHAAQRVSARRMALMVKRQ